MSKKNGTDWKRLKGMQDSDPIRARCRSWADAFFERAELHVPPKQAVTMRLDADVLNQFKEQGQGLPDADQQAAARLHAGTAAATLTRRRLGFALFAQ
jgi:BrnA antitoxin of type II toxin-antitoxin system